ncbi:MAG: branched-chain amino acid ABC transporter substrate-binding protein [Chloroflexi bacterium]|nr:branched-chain amino acid ABC transporter substrate-binding protein [Chloroflexota bacterium]
MTRAITLRLLVGLATASTLLAIACAPAAPPSPTAPPAKPAATQAPSATQPAAAKPTEKPGATPAAQATEKPGATPAAKAAGLSGTVKIVSSLPRTGSSKGQTDTMVNAMKMALEESNNKVGDATIAYDDMDDATAAKGSWDAAKEAENANKAAADQNVLLYLGTFNSGAAKVSIPILNRAGPLGMISPANTYPGLTKKVEGVEANEPDVYYPNKTRNYYRVIPADDLQGPMGASWAKDLGAKKVYILDDTELYGHGIAVAFQLAAKKLNLDVVGGPDGIDAKASDYRALAQKIKTSGADLVYFGGITQNNAGKLWQDLKAAVPDLKLMGPDGIMENAFIEAAGPAAEGSYITFGGVPPDQLKGKGADFVKKYKDKYKQDLEAYTAYGYEAARVGLKAIQDCGKKDRACVVEALSKVKNFDGVLGTWSFTETGDTTLTTGSGNTVKNGKFEFVKVLEAPK